MKKKEKKKKIPVPSYLHSLSVKSFRVLQSASKNKEEQ